jgi:Transposase, Mutator family
MSNVVKAISAHLTTLKGSVDDGFVHKLLYIGEPLEARAIVLQDGWCSKSTYRKGATMTKDHRRVDAGTAQEILLDDPGFLREIAERLVQQILEAEMNVEGVSTRKVMEITEELCGTSFSKSLISSLASTGSTGLQYIGPAFMIRHCSYSAFSLQMSEK